MVKLEFNSENIFVLNALSQLQTPFGKLIDDLIENDGLELNEEQVETLLDGLKEVEDAEMSVKNSDPDILNTVNMIRSKVTQ